MTLDDEILGRLRSQSATLRERRAETAGLLQDLVIRDIDRTRLAPHADLAGQVISLLTEHCDVSAIAQRHALQCRSMYAEALRDEASSISAMEVAASDAASAHAHAAQAALADRAGQTAEIEVLRLVQEANLIGFGLP